MRVKLNRRLGQNQQGDTVEYSDDEALWLIHKGYAVAAQDTTKSTKKATDDKRDNASGKSSDQSTRRR